MSDGLKDIHRDAIFSIFATNDRIERAVLFGSRAMGTNTVSSDVDIALFGNELTLADQAHIAEALEEIPMAQSIDLILYDSIRNTALERQINEHGIEWYQQDYHENSFDRRLMITQGNRLKTIVGDCVLINCSTYSPKENWTYINYLDTGSITENQISKIQHLVIGKDKIPSRARRKVQTGDIVYSTVRPNHRHFGLLKQPPDNCIVSTGFAVIRGKNAVAHTDFVYWFLNQDRIIRHLQTIAEHSKSAYPSIRPDDIRALRIDLPPLPEQRAIAHVLNTLDEKIELNRKMNATLETMMQALFKSWFVDFDPVQAKMEGRDTGLPKHISDLFPDRLMESELGLIPNGWSIFQLGQLVDQHTESVAPWSNPELEYEHFSIPAYDSNQCPAVDLGSEIKSNKTIIYEDSVLLSKLNPEISRVWLPCEFTDRPQICSTEFLVFTPRLPANKSLIFALFRDENFRALMRSLVTGTSKSHQRVAPKALRGYKVIVGFPDLFSKFEKVVDIFLTKILSNRSEASSLAGIRDFLLSKLVSGKVRLPYTHNIHH